MPELARVRKLKKAVEKCITSGDYKIFGAPAPANSSITQISINKIISCYDENGNELDVSEVDKCRSGIANCNVRQRINIGNGSVEDNMTFDNVSFDAKFKDDEFTVSNVDLK